MFKESLRTINGWLKKTDYIVGNKLTLADFAAYCEIDQLVLDPLYVAFSFILLFPLGFLLILVRYDVSAYPEILRWVETMKKVPFHDEAHVLLFKMLKFLKKKVNVTVTNSSKL
jgi:glutathione S-transferase